MMKSYPLLVVVLTMLMLIIQPQLSPAADHVLSVSHQWPADDQDMRHRMTTLLKEQVEKANVGFKIEIHAKSTLIKKPRDQWSAMTSGILDISVLPLAYAGTQHPVFNLTLMPGIIRSHEHAQRFNRSAVMGEIKAIMDQAGVVVLTDAWLAGGIASRTSCIREPSDAKGKWMRAAGNAFNLMLRGAGANIASMPSSDILAAFETKELDGAITSTSSLVSFEIYLEAKCLTAPGDQALWFMYEPMLMSKASFERLTPEQQAVLRSAGREAEIYAHHAAKEADKVLVDTYKEKGVEVVKMSNSQFRKWIDIAEETSYRVFREEVPQGERLLKMAKEVK